MIKLRPEQRTTVDKAKAILADKNVVYIAAEPRVGKSPMGLMTAYELGWKKVDVITKKNAIGGIEKFKTPGMFNQLRITNFEQAHKLDGDCDGYIIDEAHAAAGQYAKPSARAKTIRELIGSKPLILMSGTPTPESYSQIFHQFWLSQSGPFQRYTNFYKWSKDFVDVKKRFVNGFQINDYSRAKESEVQEAISPYMVFLSQADAGFTSFVEEEIIWVDIDVRLYQLMDVLRKNKVYKMKNTGDTIIADTPVKLQSCFHQLSSGTIKIDEKRHIIDESKAWAIHNKFAGQKIAIFYKFIAEFEVLKKVFQWTDDQPTFERNDHLVYLKQIVSGREGIDLSTADALIMYNIDFSATSYWQGKARIQTKDRIKNAKLYWVFSRNGIEKLIHKSVVKKKSYTQKYFIKDLKKWEPNLNSSQK